MDALPPVVPFYHVAPVQKINGVTVLPAPNWYLGIGKRADPFPPARPAAANYRVHMVIPIVATPIEFEPQIGPTTLPGPNLSVLPGPNQGGLPGPNPSVAIPMQASPIGPVPNSVQPTYLKIPRK